MKTLGVLSIVMLSLYINNDAFAQTSVTKTYNYNWETWSYCGGIENHIYGEVTFIMIYHYDKYGSMIAAKGNIQGLNLESETGEFYKATYLSNERINKNGTITGTFIYNLVGDLGSVLQIVRVYDIDPSTGIWTLISDKTKCL